MVGAMELEVVVGGADLGIEFSEASEDVLVEGLHRRKYDAVCRGIEVVEVAEEEAKGVAQLAVVVADALHEVFAGGNIFAEIDRSDPQAHDLCAKTLRNVNRIDAGAEGLRERAPLLVERPAAGGDHLVRSFAAYCNRGE